MFGNHWARLFEEGFLFFTLGEIFNDDFSNFFEMAGIIMYHYASFKEREIEEVWVAF